MVLTPRTGQWVLEARGLQALRNVFISPPPHPRERWRGRGTLQLPTFPPAFQAPCTGHFAKDEKEKSGPPHCHVLALSNKSDSVLEKRRGL